MKWHAHACLSEKGWVRGPLIPDCQAEAGSVDLQVVATHLPPEEIEGIRQMFIDMDKDGSGTISFEELREGEAASRRP